MTARGSALRAGARDRTRARITCEPTPDTTTRVRRIEFAASRHIAFGSLRHGAATILQALRADNG